MSAEEIAATMPPPSATAHRAVPAPKDKSDEMPKMRKPGKRVLVYGEGGVGKTTLATKLAGRTLFFDLERSLYDLFDEIPENVVAVCPTTWEDVEKYMASDRAKTYDNLVVDSLTSLESMFWTYIATHCRRAKDGFGRVDFFDKPLPALKDEKELGGGGADSAKYAMWTRYEGLMTMLSAEGVNVVNLCHDCEKTRDDSSDGVDTRHEPRLNDPNSGKNSIRKRAYEVSGEVYFIKWEKIRKDDKHAKLTGRRIVLGQPTEDEAGDFSGVMSKSRRGFSKAYLDEFDINQVLGIVK